MVTFLSETEELYKFPEVERPPGCKVTAPNVSVQNHRCPCMHLWLYSQGNMESGQRYTSSLRSSPLWALGPARESLMKHPGMHTRTSTWTSQTRSRKAEVKQNKAKGRERLERTNKDELVHFSSHQTATLAYSSSVSFGICISSSKLLPPDEKGKEDAMKQVFSN